MAAKIDPYLTDVGLAAAIDARKNGLQLSITHVALGSGKYNSNTSGASKTAMVALKEKVTIPAGSVSGTGGFSCDVIFPEWPGATYDATELGFFAGDPSAGGKLIFIWSSTTEVLVQRNLLQFVAAFIFQLTRLPTDSITVQLDSQASLAASLVGLHEAKEDPHPRYLKRDGDKATGWIEFLTPPRLDRSKKAATTEGVAASGVGYPSNGGIGVGDDYFLTSEQGNMWFDLQTNNKSIVLPPSSGVDIGTTFTIRCNVDIGALRVSGADLIEPGEGSGPTKAIYLNRGDIYQVTRNEKGFYYVVNQSRASSVGQIAYFPGLVVPPAWSELNGALLSREWYPRLWRFAQTAGLVSENDWMNNGYWGRFSSGTNGSNFRLPDLRSVFLRGLDNGRGNFDPNREWGRFQDSMNRWHNHAVQDGMHSHTGYTNVNGQHTHGIPDADSHESWGASVDSGNRAPWNWLQTTAAGAHDHSVYTYSSYSNISLYAEGGSESRPSNQAFICCIRNN